MKTYSELIKETDRIYYSLNFLLAEFESIENLEKKVAVMNDRIHCNHFETKDFKPEPYYKAISSCIKNF